MNIGSTVWYRLTEEDAEKVNRWRNTASKYRSSKGFCSTGCQEHFGNRVNAGELLPATVVRCYSAAAMGHEVYGFPAAPDAVKDFSGVAGIRVLLPGNDVLYVPKAKMDMNPVSDETMGHGVTSLPAHGMFTASIPAPLL